MRHNRLVAVLILFGLFTVVAAKAALKLPALVGDNMVLQQGKQLRIWGSADPQEKVTVSFCGQSVAGIADDKGNWSLILRPVKAGGPFDLTIASKDTIT